MPATPLSPATTPYYGGGQVATPANVLYGIVSPPSNNAATGGGILYINTLNGDVYVSYKPGAWSIAASATGAVSTLTGNTGGAISPTAGNINIVGGTNVTVAGSGSTLTINSTSVPSVVTTAVNVSPGITNTAYLANAAATITILLPGTSAVGDTFEVLGNLNVGGSWQITQAAGQQVRFGNGETTAGAGGSLTAADYRQSVSLRCIVASLTWVAISASGTITPA
jgi:hypothetical protein